MLPVEWRGQDLRMHLRPPSSASMVRCAYERSRIAPRRFPPRPTCDRREMKGWSPEELLHFEEWVGPKVAFLLPSARALLT